MQHLPHFARRVLIPALMAVLFFPVATASAQLFQLDGGKPIGTLGRAKRDSPATVTLTSTAETVTLNITMKLPEGAHVYSTSKGFSGRTRIDVKFATGLESIDDDFKPARKPISKFDKDFDQEVEYFEKEITWARRYKLAKGASASDVKVTGSLRYQVCDAQSCRPFNDPFDLSLAASAPKFEQKIVPMLKSGGVEKPGPVAWTVRLSPAKPEPGKNATLSITAKIEQDYHVFAVDQNPKNFGKPTELNDLKLRGLAEIPDSKLQPDHAAEEHETLNKIQRIHHNEITWTREFTVAADATPASYGLSGRIDYQVCFGGPKGNCRAGKVEFELGTLGESQVTAAVVDLPAAGAGTTGSDLFDQIRTRKPVGSTDPAAALAIAEETETKEGLLTYLLYAFIGGLILNVMPCVLPVIAIKVLGFVQQAGESRSRILLLNGAYSLGVIGVFVLLASLAAFFGLKWGGLFQRTEFNIAMTFVVFAMGLSLLGVFEIPIPGLGGSVGAQHREGPLGAFLTGIFATLLATPCSGPFLGVTFTWSLKQSPEVIYLVWTMIGLGMASPYLVLGLFPQAVKFLPKPGNWMVRFKEFSGFVLLATTIYLLSILKDELLIPVLTAMLGTGLGLWMIGHLYDLNSTTGQRWRVRITALCLGGLISGAGVYLHLHKAEGWQPFSPQAVASALEEGRPVVVDFTADWCLTCKTMEHTTLNTDSTQALFKKHGFVAFQADWTDGSPEITNILSKLGADSIPVLAVFSPSRPTEPIVIRDAWTQSHLHTQLEAVINESGGGVPVNTDNTSTSPGTAMR
jgi:suppressor for copper-sensitivity B